MSETEEERDWDDTALLTKHSRRDMPFVIELSNQTGQKYFDITKKKNLKCLVLVNEKKRYPSGCVQDRIGIYLDGGERSGAGERTKMENWRSRKAFCFLLTYTCLTLGCSKMESLVSLSHEQKPFAEDSKEMLALVYRYVL